MPAQVKPEDRKNHSATGDGRFPIATKQQAISAIRLRGHAKDKSERRAILRRASKFVPEMARKAMEEDRKSGAI